LIKTTNFITAKNILFGDSLGRTGTLTQIQNDILTDFEDSPSYELVTINNPLTPQKVQIVTITNSSKENYKKILSKPLETFAVGDIVVWGSLTFLITDIDEDTQVQTKGSIQLCNNTLSFYSTIDSILYSIPCIITDKTNINLKDNKYISTIDCDIIAIVSYNMINNLISPNDIFKIGRWNYTVLKPDDISKPGLIIIPMKFVEEEATTHVFAVNILNPTYYTYAYLNRGMMMDLNDGLAINVKSGEELQLNVKVLDNNVVISPTPVISYISSDTDIATVDNDGLVTMISVGSCVVTASANGVSDTIKICVSESEQHNYSYSLVSTSVPDIDEIKLNQTKSYVATKYENGIAITQGFTMSVSGDSSAYTLTVLDDNNCTIKCLKSGYTVVLSATDVSDVTKVTTKSIILKSLF